MRKIIEIELVGGLAGRLSPDCSGGNECLKVTVEHVQAASNPDLANDYIEIAVELKKKLHIRFRGEDGLDSVWEASSMASGLAQVGSSNDLPIGEHLSDALLSLPKPKN